jgi:methylmalonyl-CoA mutase N-terminal domain/subunit
MGYDSDDPLVREEVGGVGVAIDTVDDMETVFEGIPLDQISSHFTINATAAVIFAMYLVMAEKQGIPFARISGTLQNDILKEYISRNAYIFPPRPALRLIADIIIYAYEKVPRFNPISITGYHAREAGASAVQEIAYTLSAAVTYVEMMLDRGIDVDTFAPRLSFHFSNQRDFFEEICKIRAARRLWARIMKERFRAKTSKSQLMRYFNGGSGASLAHAEPMNNVIRGTLQCLAGVLAGAQACHVPSFDEAYTIPSEEAALLSVRTQQIIAHESGVPAVIDPLGGSYFVEALTDQIERDVEKLMRQIESRGGLVAGIEKGEIRQVIAARAYELEKQIERGERKIVGVNAFVGDQAKMGVPAIPERDPEVVERQIARLKKVKSKRDAGRVQRVLSELRQIAEGTENLMPPMLEAVRAYATVGEITAVLKEVFGTYRGPTTF